MNHRMIDKEKLIARYVQNKLAPDQRQALEQHYSSCKSCQDALHAEIGRAELIDKFVRNRLSPEEAVFFDEHYFGCDRCFRAVKEAEKVSLAIRDGVKRGALALDAESVPAWKLVIGRVNAFISSPAIGYAAVFLVLILLWQGLRLRSELNDLRQPQAVAPRGYHLLQDTDGVRGETGDIVLFPEDKVFMLEFTLPEKIDREARYRAEILDSREKPVWEMGELAAAGIYEVFTITCLRLSFAEGEYILKVYKVKPDHSIGKAFSFPFKVIFQK